MIVTTLEQLGKQLASNTKFEKAMDFLRREGWRGQSDGRIEIDGDKVFALLQSYKTKLPQSAIPFEGHRKYIDVQYVIEGKETMYWTPTNRLTPTVAYDDAKDIWFSHTPRGDAATIVAVPGQPVVFFPEDAHAPSHTVDQPARVRKIIVKVAVA